MHAHIGYQREQEFAIADLGEIVVQRFFHLLNGERRRNVFGFDDNAYHHVQRVVHEDRAMIAYGNRTSLALLIFPVVNGILRSLEWHAVGEDVGYARAQLAPALPIEVSVAAGLEDPAHGGAGVPHGRGPTDRRI